MKIDFSRTTLLTIIGVQVIMFICLYALLNRVGKLESKHEKETDKSEKYVFKE